MTTRILDTTKLSDSARALSLKFAKRIIGQPKPTVALTKLLAKQQSKCRDLTKPIGSALFLGPTGTGKTATVEAFCEGLFGNANAMLKVDCAEFQHSHEIAKLIGSPPGYLGHRETHPYFTQEALNAHFTEKLKLSVVLFDEIEKASDSLWNLLLGILDKSTLTLGDNRRVDFSNTIIIMTSNIGAAELAAKVGDTGMGFATVNMEVPAEEMETIAIAAARRKFTPEFMNRLDEVIVFNTLKPQDIEQILSLELDKLQERIIVQSDKLFTLNVSPKAMEQILKEGYSKRDNARFLKRTVDKYVADPIASLLATDQIINGDTIVVDCHAEWDHPAEWSYYAQGNGDVLFP